MRDYAYKRAIWLRCGSGRFPRVARRPFCGRKNDKRMGGLSRSTKFVCLIQMSINREKRPIGECEVGFPPAGSGMSALIRELDWSATSLGPIAGWPPHLKAAVRIMLPAKAQIVLFWGPEFVALYNDA